MVKIFHKIFFFLFISLQCVKKSENNIQYTCVSVCVCVGLYLSSHTHTLIELLRWGLGGIALGRIEEEEKNSLAGVYDCIAPRLL